MHWPTDEQRTVILGRTGSGKTFFAVWLLCYYATYYTDLPFVIIDYKGDSLIETIVKQNKLKEIKPTDSPPKKPGVYIMHPRPRLDDDAMEAFLLACWKQEDIGIYVDEGYALPQKAAFDMLLTQGRSKHIPVIALYQRPVWMSRFAVAQADYFAVFEQNDKRDLQTTNRFIKEYVSPDGKMRADAYTQLPQFHCLWYDVSAGKTEILSPVPGRNTILASFRRALGNEERQERTIDNGVYIL